MIDIFEVSELVTQAVDCTLDQGLERAHDLAKTLRINKKWARKPIAKTEKVYQETPVGTTESSALTSCGSRFRHCPRRRYDGSISGPNRTRIKRLTVIPRASNMRLTSRLRPSRSTT